MSVSEPLQLLGWSRSRTYTHGQLVFRSIDALVSHVNFTTSCGGGAISERRCSAALSSSLSAKTGQPVNAESLNTARSASSPCNFAINRETSDQHSGQMCKWARES